MNLAHSIAIVVGVISAAHLIRHCRAMAIRATRTKTDELYRLGQNSFSSNFYVLRAKYVLMGSGFEWPDLPISRHQRYYAIARNVVEMGVKLRTMEKTMEILNNATAKTIDTVMRTDKTADDRYTIEVQTDNIVSLMDGYFAETTQSVGNLSRVKFVDINEFNSNCDVSELFNRATSLGENCIKNLKFWMSKYFLDSGLKANKTSVQKKYYVVARSILELGHIVENETETSAALQFHYDRAIDNVIENPDTEILQSLKTEFNDYCEIFQKNRQQLVEMVERRDEWSRNSFEDSVLVELSASFDKRRHRSKSQPTVLH